MASITIKNIPDKLYQDLKKAAAVQRRSINSQVIYCIENTITSSKIDPEEFIASIESFHEHVDMPFLTENMLQEYKTSGRK